MPTKTQRLRNYLEKALQITEELCADEEEATFSQSDSNLIADLHRFVWIANMQAGKPVHRSRLLGFLHQRRCEPQRALALLDMICTIGWLAREDDSFTAQQRGLVTQTEEPPDDTSK